MDNTIQIKNDLITKIKRSTDVQLLKNLQAILDNSEQELFELSVSQKKAIELGRNDIENGDFKSHHKVMSETKEWLKRM